MITKLEIDGFKTFENFKIELSPFVVIAGANGSGKSNLFDAIQLLSRLADNDLKSAFVGETQRGEARELFTQYPDGSYAKSMRFLIEVLVDKPVKDSWGNETSLTYTRLRYIVEISRGKEKKGLEKLYLSKEELVPIKKADDTWYKCYVGTQNDYWSPKFKTGRTIAYINTELDLKSKVSTIYLQKDGTKRGKSRANRAENVERTVLSGVANTEFPHAFAMREEMRNWKFLQLNPVTLSKPSARFAKDFIGTDGSNLPTTLARMKAEDSFVIKDLSAEINNLLLGMTAIDVIEDIRSDQYVLVSTSQDGRQFSSRVLSEGTLRVLALCALKFDTRHKGVLCLEEPENGIYPVRLENLITLLRDLATHFQEDTNIPLRQILVNTHSPVLLSHLFKNAEIDCNVFYAMLLSKVDPIKKQSFRFTKIIPVTPQSSLEFGITKPEQTITFSEVLRYLQTQEFDKDILKRVMGTER